MLPEFTVPFSDDFFNMVVRDVHTDARTVGESCPQPISVPRPRPLIPLLPRLRPRASASPYAEPRVYGLRMAVKRELSAGSLIKTGYGGKWRHVIFRGRVSAVLWLNARYSREWPEFIEIERLRVDQLAALDAPVFPEEMVLSPKSSSTMEAFHE